jgi:hypothetical protein
MSDVDVSRRDHLNSILGVLGGAVGLSAVQGCQPSPNGESTGTTGQALGGMGPVVYADTVDDLRDVTLSGSAAILGGYHAVGDGGGGVFTWSSAAQADDGGTVFNVNAANGPGWRRIFSGPIDVRWFGARGDGTTPDDGAFLSAIGAAAAIASAAGKNLDSPASNPAGSVEVYVPPGTYVLTGTLNGGSPLPPGLILRGAGEASCLYFTGTGGAAGAEAAGAGILVTSTALNTNTQTTVRICDLWLRSVIPANNGTVAIDLIGATLITISRCKLTGWTAGIILDGAECIEIDNINFGANGSEGDQTANTIGIWFTNAASGNKGFTVPECTNRIAVHDCQFNAPALPIRDEGSVSHHVYDNNVNGCIKCFAWISYCNAAIYEKNELEGCGAATIGWIYIDGPTYNLTIRDNSFSGGGLPGGGSASVPSVYFEGGFVYGFDFSDNFIAGTPVAAISMSPGSIPFFGPTYIAGNFCPNAPLIPPGVQPMESGAAAFALNRETITGGSAVGINTIDPAANLEVRVVGPTPAFQVSDLNHQYFRLTANGSPPAMSFCANQGFSGDNGTVDLVSQVSTTPAQPMQTAFTYPVAGNVKTIRAEVVATAIASDSADAATFKQHWTLFRWGGGLQGIGNPSSDEATFTPNASGWTVVMTIDPSGQNLVVNVVGPVDNGVWWTASLRIVQGGN